MADSINNSIKTWDFESCKPYLSIPKPSDHKYKRGVLGCFTGSRQYPGAALLTTAAALSVGIGMVRYFGPRSVARAVIQNRAEIVLKNGPIDAMLLGSGIPSTGARLRKLTLRIANRKAVPKVLDAGALFLAGKSNSPTIITPHSGELAKMLRVEVAQIEAERIKFAKEAANLFKVAVLLKGSETIVTDGKNTNILPTASSWLATAGTGDVLAGLLGGLIVINKGNLNHKNIVEVGATAAFIHAKAAALIDGPISSTKLIEAIQKIVSDLAE